MVGLIKSVTLQLISEIHSRGIHEIDIIELTSILQQRIIINISVGPGFADRIIDSESFDGKISKKPIYNVIYDVIQWTCTRAQHPLNVFIPELLPYALCSKDRCVYRNI